MDHLIPIESLPRYEGLTPPRAGAQPRRSIAAVLSISLLPSSTRTGDRCRAPGVPMPRR